MNCSYFVTAKVVVELAKHSYIQAGVLLHPSLVTVEDIQGTKFFCQVSIDNA